MENQQNKSQTAKTLQAYNLIIDECKDIFSKKNQDYGTSWTILRGASLTDQLYIKAMRLRSIEENKEQAIDDDIRDDYKGLINYGLMALIQSERKSADFFDDIKALKEKYTNQVERVRNLMLRKNQDYGEAWRTMRVSSMTDLILVKLLRIKQIEENQGQTIVSENVESNLMDIINYAIFAMILLRE